MNWFFFLFLSNRAAFLDFNGHHLCHLYHLYSVGRYSKCVGAAFNEDHIKSTLMKSIKIVSAFQGGVAAVIWTDVLQVAVIYISIVALAVKGTMEVGSFSDIWEKNRLGRRTIFFQ